jgi:hypothetical protein
MQRSSVQLVAVMLLVAGSLAVGCGTTRSTDTVRTASEQLLISNAIDKAVQSIDLKTLSGQSVYLDDSRLGEVVDRNYLVSTLRQHLLANGCRLKDQKEQADFIVEARAGAVGTDRNDLLFGVPSTNVPQIMPVQPVPAAVIPEIPIAKRRDQKGIAKLAVFAYHRETGTPVWQSGLVHQESSANDVWILGAGPFQRGSIYEGTEFAGKALRGEADKKEAVPRRLPAVELASESTFTKPSQLAKTQAAPAAPAPATAAVPAPAASPIPEQPVVQANHEESQSLASPPADAKPVTEQTAAPAVAETPESAKPPETHSVYEPAGTTTLPQPRFESR